LRFEQSGHAVIAEVIDSGRPIPKEHWQRKADAPFDFDPDNLASLPEHGMGLALIRLSFDVVNYESAGGINRLTMAKRFGTTEGIAGSDE
jgi:serine/threonine-protein kinase RsbW